MGTICTWFLQSKSFCSISGQLELGHRQLPLSSSGGELVDIRLDEQSDILGAWTSGCSTTGPQLSLALARLSLGLW